MSFATNCRYCGKPLEGFETTVCKFCMNTPPTGREEGMSESNQDDERDHTYFTCGQCDKLIDCIHNRPMAVCGNDPACEDFSMSQAHAQCTHMQTLCTHEPVSLPNPEILNQQGPPPEPPPTDPRDIQIHELFSRVITLEARVNDIRSELKYGPSKTVLT